MKNQLTRTLLSALLILGLFQSCKKENNPQHFIKFKVDGEWITWTKAAYLLEETGTDLYYLTVVGRSADLDNVFIVGVEVSGTLQPGTYDSQNDGLEFSYATGAAAGGAATKMYYSQPGGGRPAPHFIVNITSVSENEIRGNFTGDYLAADDGAVIEFTEGEFVAKTDE
jgi:hypothetical protein